MTESETIEVTEPPWDRLHELIDTRDGHAVEELLESLEPAETVRALFRLSRSDQETLMSLLSPDRAAELIEDLPDTHAAELIGELAAGQAATIVEELSSDRGADLLAELDEHDAEAILDEMTPEIAAHVRGLIVYAQDVAGGLMVPERFAYAQSARVRDFLDDLATDRDDHEQLPQRILLLDADRHLTGAVEIAEILLADRETRLAELSEPVLPVAADATLEDLEDYFDRYETLGAPVVDGAGRLIGRLRRRALAEALTERSQDDQLKIQGIVGGEELRSMPILTRSGRRLSWLSVNILLNIVSASVIAVFQDTVSAVIALAVFLPIVSDMSGCSGNQAVAVSMRELTLGIVQPRDVLRVWWQEVSVGLFNGIALGILLSVVAYFWKGSPMLGIVVGGALALNTIIAVSIGGTVPLLLKYFKADPAVASGPVLTTITDVCGFMLLLGLATLALPWLM